VIGLLLVALSSRGSEVNTYCYNITRHGRKLVGGTMSADSMEEASRQVLKVNKIKAVQTASGTRPCDSKPWKTVKLYRDGKEVFAHVSVCAESILPPEEIEIKG